MSGLPPARHGALPLTTFPATRRGAVRAGGGIAARDAAPPPGPTNTMTRSRRHNPITGNCVCRSEKAWKRFAHKRRRTAERSRGSDLPDRAYADCWWWGKDGKHRFDPQAWPQGMRK